MRYLLILLTAIFAVACSEGEKGGDRDITSLFKDRWNINEEVIHNSDGTITYNALQWGGLVADFKNQEQPEDWTKYEKIVFEFAERTTVRTQLMINDKIVSEIQASIKQIHYAAQYDGLKVADLRTNYAVGCNEAGNTVILSIILTKSNYYERAAHPATYMHALNFNVGSGTLMGLDYLTDIGEGVSVEKLRGRVEQALIRHCSAAQKSARKFLLGRKSSRALHLPTLRRCAVCRGHYRR